LGEDREIATLARIPSRGGHAARDLLLDENDDERRPAVDRAVEDRARQLELGMRPIENLAADRGRKIELPLEQCDRPTLSDRRPIFDPEELVDPRPVGVLPGVE